MKLLHTFITISFISTIVSSSKCKNHELKCIELCCNATQYYNDKYEYCDNIPEVDKASWNVLLHSNKTMEFVEYGVCNRSSNITSCHAPYYSTETRQLVLRRWFNVPCDRLDEPIFVWPVGVLVYLGVLPFCLPIMMVYTCRKGLKEKFIIKLVSWYLAFLVFGLLTEAVGALSDIMPKTFEVRLREFFFISTCLWLNVIGYQIWSGFRQLNAEKNNDNNRRRFICYSIYVWGIASLVAVLDYMISGRRWNLYVNFTIAVYNVVTFLILSVNICMTRYKVMELTNETGLKRQLLYVICRLCLMMGIPRMLFLISKVFIQFSLLTQFVVTIQEPFVMFIVLVLKPKNVFNWIFVCCCCRKSEQISNASQEKDMTTVTNTDTIEEQSEIDKK